MCFSLYMQKNARTKLNTNGGIIDSERSLISVLQFINEYGDASV